MISRDSSGRVAVLSAPVQPFCLALLGNPDLRGLHVATVILLHNAQIVCVIGGLLVHGEHCWPLPDREQRFLGVLVLLQALEFARLLLVDLLHLSLVVEVPDRHLLALSHINTAAHFEHCNTYHVWWNRHFEPGVP